MKLPIVSDTASGAMLVGAERAKDIGMMEFQAFRPAFEFSIVLIFYPSIMNHVYLQIRNLHFNICRSFELLAMSSLCSMSHALPTSTAAP